MPGLFAVRLSVCNGFSWSQPCLAADVAFLLSREGAELQRRTGIIFTGDAKASVCALRKGIILMMPSGYALT